jgi:RimJ/RimL family protein N-acetyltransferase
VPLSDVTAILESRQVDGARWADGYPFEGSVGGARLVSRMMEAGTYRPGFGMYQITLKSSGLVIGDLGFHSAPDDNGSVEIGYGLVDEFHNKGYATEAVQRLVSWALAQDSVNEITAETDPDHIPSQRVLMKCGFEDAGKDELAHRFSCKARGRA